MATKITGREGAGIVARHLQEYASIMRSSSNVFWSAVTALGFTCVLACTPSPTAESPTLAEPTGAPAGLSSAEPTTTQTTAPPPSKAGSEGAMCGGIAGFGCAAQLYCDFALEAHCGAADQTGVCKPIPEMCTAQYQPVCGCNDKTYPNACSAAREGVAIAAEGECAASTPPALAEGQLCGTRGVQGTCADSLYCKYKSACGATDSGGSCVPRPQACTRIYKPVCGCDGKTYPSDCVAASAGVDVANAGACP